MLETAVTFSNPVSSRMKFSGACFSTTRAFTGTLVVSAVSQLTGQTSLGILSLVALFAIGLALLVVSSRTPSDGGPSDAPCAEAQSA